VDQVIKSEFLIDRHDDMLHHRRTQPTEDLILARNAELRKDNVLNDLSFGRQVASIPFIMWEKAVRDGYDLANPDQDIHSREMFRYLKSENGKKCLVRSRV
jgi:hypothetical protein